MEYSHTTKCLFQVLLFLWIGFLLPHHKVCNGADITRKTLTAIHDTRFGVERLGLPWSAISPSECYFTCWAKFNSQCQTIMYNAYTNLCTPGSFVRSTNFNGASAPTSTEGVLYAQPACDKSDDFDHVTTSNASACIKVSTMVLSSNDAANHCRQLGAHLFVARSLDRLDLLPTGKRLIIGLNDIATEGTFVWPDKGDAISDDYKTLLFESDEPNNLGNEDCVTVIGGAGANSGNDIPCDFVWWKLVCERPMFNLLP